MRPFVLALLALLPLSLLSGPSVSAQAREGDRRAPERDSLIIEMSNRRIVVEGTGDSARVVVRRDGRSRTDTVHLRVPDLDRVFRRVRVVDGDSTVSLDSMLIRGGRRWRVRLDSIFGGPERRERTERTGRDADGSAATRSRGHVVEETVTRGTDGAVVTRRVVTRTDDGTGEPTELRVEVDGDVIRIDDGTGVRTVRRPPSGEGRPATPERRADGTVVVPDRDGGTWIYVPPSDATRTAPPPRPAPRNRP